ncbi:class I SAM-dependent methyltransferase [Thiomicrolovo sp. ZZH C-3]
MPRIDNRCFYTTALERHGLTAGGVHWNSDASQSKRFEVIASLLPDTLDGVTLTDAGCGFGDLFCYLREHRRTPLHYLGLDCMDPMVEEARKRTGCEIRRADILHDALDAADYYVCSGAMNLLTPAETRRFIERCYAASRRGFVFNLLEGDDDSIAYNYMRPSTVRKIAQELGANVQIRRGYLKRDFTVALYKEAPQGGKS